jgi:hypothetical protein
MEGCDGLDAVPRTLVPCASRQTHRIRARGRPGRTTCGGDDGEGGVASEQGLALRRALSCANLGRRMKADAGNALQRPDWTPMVGSRLSERVPRLCSSAGDSERACGGMEAERLFEYTSGEIQMRGGFAPWEA